MSEFVYQVRNSAGQIVVQALECCRYSRDIELQRLENGDTIWLHGKRLTKKEIMSREKNEG